MFNVLLISRIKRLIKNDPTLPVQCFSKLMYSSNEGCFCKYHCKYSKIDEQVINKSIYIDKPIQSNKIP